MKIYISGKITGDKHWKRKFKRAEKEVKKRFGKDTVVFNPLLTSIFENKISWEDFMVLDYAYIDISDGLYMLNDWVNSKGAKLEFDYAFDKKKKIYYQERVK